MCSRTRKDLLVLAADRNMEAALVGLLNRRQSLRIREISFDVRVHPHRDSGCLHEGVTFLQPFQTQYDHALLIFDLEGSGDHQRSAEEIQNSLTDQLSASGWADRAAAIVIVPELEAWVWSGSPHVAEHLGWQGTMQQLRDWLSARKLWLSNHAKPVRPKEAVELVLQKTRRPRSSAIYAAIASSVSVERCLDMSFVNLKETLRRWFAQ